VNDPFILQRNGSDRAGLLSRLTYAFATPGGGYRAEGGVLPNGSWATVFRD